MKNNNEIEEAESGSSPVGSDVVKDVLNSGTFYEKGQSIGGSFTIPSSHTIQYSNLTSFTNISRW